MSNFMFSYIKLKIGIGFGLGLFILIGVQYVSNKSIKKVLASQHELRHSSELSTRVESIKSSLIFFESKIKSYSLTGESSFMDKNAAHLSSVFAEYAALGGLNPNTEQIDLIKKSKVLIYKEVGFAQQILIEYEQDPAQAIAFIKTGQGMALITELTAVLDHINQIESDKFSAIIARNSDLTKQVVQMDIMAYLFAFVLIGLSIIILYRDITKRENLEKELYIIQGKAEQASAIKEQFMANMSHEIRTPMNAIIGFSNRLNKTSLNTEQAEYVSAVKSSGDNLLAIINDILDFSKIEAGMVRIEEVRFNLPGLLESVILMFGNQAKEHNLHLNIHTSDNLPEYLMGDPTRLTQILINLIGNALKFTKEGSIDVSASLLKETEGEVRIQFLIKDSGIGIPADMLSEIFERFTQAKSDTTRIFGGTGLGLSIVKKLVELQKGTVSVTSTKGNGSTFQVIIPYKRAAELTPKPIAAMNIAISPAIAAGKRILVVEDNLLNQKLAGFMLKEWGFQYDLSSNGKLALEKLKTGTFDLILMDMQMPELNGYETTQCIRNEFKLTLPIIAMTAHALPGEREKCLSFGMSDYLSKPINETELFTMLNTHLFSHTSLILKS
jgi:signal transduction histidine kinase/ActR/RegA family two-component response regulator